MRAKKKKAREKKTSTFLCEKERYSHWTMNSAGVSDETQEASLAEGERIKNQIEWGERISEKMSAQAGTGVRVQSRKKKRR